LNAEDGWSEAKKTWCCEREEKGCGEERYDCDAGLSNAERGWSEAKKAWCCEREEKGCGEAAPPKSEPTAAPPPPARLLEEVRGLDDPALALTASGILPSTSVQPSGPAPPREPLEEEVEAQADVEASSMAIGMIVVAAGGSLWTLCLWYVQQKRTLARLRRGPADSDATDLQGIEVYIDVNGDVEKDKDAPQTTEAFCIHLTEELAGEKNTAYLPL
jgi:hypothetical protein